MNLNKAFALTIAALPVLIKGDNSDYKCLKQKDFDKGTFIIRENGSRYKLCEDIVFNPNKETTQDPATAFEPDFELFDKFAFGLGFFSALSIAADDVVLDLNGRTIEQSKEHALLQRFFAVIELADSPFIAGVGPAEFVGEECIRIKNPAKNVEIHGPGTIGLSSHHGIHGNENSDVQIRDVTFKDFEVAAVSLNNVDTLTIEDCEIKHNRQDVPILGMFSAARFIIPYGKALKESNYEMKLRGKKVSAKVVYDNLAKSITNVYEDVIKKGGFINEKKHPAEYNLYANKKRVVDGPCYGFLVHGKGPAVGGFAVKFNETDPSTTSSNIVIRNNKINNIKCWTNEVPATVLPTKIPDKKCSSDDKKVMTDVRGSTFQLIASDNTPIAMNEDGTYKGNVVADMQIMVANAISTGSVTLPDVLQVKPLSLDKNTTIIEWASSGKKKFFPKYRCNGDSMHHVVKGVTVIRVDETVGFEITNNEIKEIANLSPKKFGDCTDFNTDKVTDNAGIQQGANIRGISAAAVSSFNPHTSNKDSRESSKISGNKLYDFKSEEADIIVGVDIQGMSNSIDITKNTVSLTTQDVFPLKRDVYASLRVVKFIGVEKDFGIVEKENVFSHDVISRMVKEYDERKPMETTWVNGACPMSKLSNLAPKEECAKPKKKECPPVDPTVTVLVEPASEGKKGKSGKKGKKGKSGKKGKKGKSAKKGKKGKSAKKGKKDARDAGEL